MVSASISPYPESYAVPAGGRVSGRLALPGSKSLTQRYFALALLHRRPLRVVRPLLSEDTHHFLDALRATGFDVHHEPDAVRLEPKAAPAPSTPADEAERVEIFCGAGGTMFRFLTAALAAVPGRWRLDGIARLRERTVAPLLAAARQLGAEIRCPGQEGFAPLEIEGGSLRGGACVLDAGASSQFLSALLLAGTAAPEPVTVTVEALTSEPYVDLTLDAIHELGGRVERHERDGRAVYRVERFELDRQEIEVEADFSSVAYPAAAAALTGGEVVLEGVRASSRQGDRGFVDLLGQMGAEIEWLDDGGLRVRGTGRLEAIEADLSAMPDQVPTLAALAPFARGTTRISNVPHLRIKESDRLRAMATELAKAGARVEEHADGLTLEGVWAEGVPAGLAEAELASWGDHRIAMAMALVGLRRPGLSIRQPAVVAKSYPQFWTDLERLLDG